MKDFDVIIIGAGGAGLMCAIQSGRRGRKVALLDHSQKIGAKILISGGGRCNFTNLEVGPENYVSQNPHFCKSALTRFRPNDFIQMVKDHQIPYHEKKLGQLFCDRSAKDIIGMLEDESRKVGVEIHTGIKVGKMERSERFHLETTNGEYSSHSLVIATGGLSIPKVGATDFGYLIARQFGLKVVETAPALDGFHLKPPDMKNFKDLMGVSVDATVTSGKTSFRENILFTHTGISCPAALQISLYWHPGRTLIINFIPKASPAKMIQWFLDCKRQGSKSEMKTLMKEWLPHRLAERVCDLELKPGITVPRVSKESVEKFFNKIQNYPLIPQSTVGYGKAEVTRGGVDTDELSSKTMESKKVPGLFFIGEVVDVTGWLGGYNFQWAWSSGWAAGQSA